jgi:uncharacterized surface protein with fasciclin (FAS1) repeats
MKKRTLLLLLTLIVGLALPVAAQSGDSLVDRLAADGEGRFTTLVSALEAAGLAETLSADGDYTVFAPTNDAFDAALESLGVSLDALLGDTDLLTQILTTHVVADDRVFFREFSRTPALTSLEGSELTLAVEGGVPTVNGIAISGIDRSSSNGVFHVIDGVLLPPDLADAVAAAAPEATDVAEAPAEATEAAVLMGENEAMLRFAFLSPDSPPLVLAINGEPVSDANPAEFPSVSEWMVVPAGTMTISGMPEGEGMEALLYPFELTLNDGTWTTLAIVGSEPNGTFIAQPVLEDYSPIADGNARITVFHGIEGAPAVDLLVNGRVVVDQLAYPGSRGENDGAFVIEVPAGSADLQVVLTGTSSGGQNNGVSLLEEDGFEIADGSSTFLAAAGTREEPVLVVDTVDVASLTGE